MMEGYSVTRPLRTIIDVAAAAAISADLLEQAIRQGLQRGLVERDDLPKAAKLNPSSFFVEIVRSLVS